MRNRGFKNFNKKLKKNYTSLADEAPFETLERSLTTIVFDRHIGDCTNERLSGAEGLTVPVISLKGNRLEGYTQPYLFIFKGPSWKVREMKGQVSTRGWM